MKISPQKSNYFSSNFYSVLPVLLYLLVSPNQPIYSLDIEEMTSNFVIFHQAAGATPAGVTQLQPNTTEYTYVASAVSIALSILEHPVSRQCLRQLALDYDNDRGRTRFRNDPVLARNFVDLFLAKIRANFPMIVINDTMINRGLLGYHPRGEWEGTYQSFNPRQQSVNVNGLVSFPVRVE